MTARTYAYAVHLDALDALWNTGRAGELAQRLVECDEEAQMDVAELASLLERRMSGETLHGDAQLLLDEALAVFLAECLDGEPLTDVDFPSAGYEELVEILSEQSRLSEWERRALLVWGLGRGWGEDLPFLSAAARPGGYFRSDELPNVRAAFAAALRMLRGPDLQAFRPLLEEALAVLDEAILTGRDLVLRLT